MIVNLREISIAENFIFLTYLTFESFIDYDKVMTTYTNLQHKNVYLKREKYF